MGTPRMEFNKIRFYQRHKQNLICKVEEDHYSELLKDHIGLHSTDYLTPYISLWARVKNFEPKRLFDDLNEPWSAIRARAFRGTLFVIHKDNLKTIFGAAKIFLSPIVKNFEKFLLKSGLNASSIEKEIIDLLSNKNQLTVNELKKQLPDHLVGENFTYALRYLEFKGVLVRTNHRYITDRVIRYGLLEDWFPEIKISEIDAEEALTKLVINYVKKFGPICFDDLSWWLSITKTATKKILNNLDKRLVTFNYNDRNYHMEKSDYERFENFDFDHDQNIIIDFLPYEDHFVKAYKIRDWFLADEITSLVSKKGPMYQGQIFPTIWMNRKIIGGWEMNWVDHSKTAMTVKITAINNKSKLSQKIYQLIEDQRGELEKFINEKLVPLMKRKSM